MNKNKMFSLEHSKASYWFDFVLYGSVVLTLAWLVAHSTLGFWEIAVWIILGLIGWSILEYGLHRFVLHGIEPFRSWHVEHHLRPAALIGTPTILSVTLIALLIFLPALMLGNVWRAAALTLGLTAGYQIYAITHHAIHHWQSSNPWLMRKKRWHALHHHNSISQNTCFGVTGRLWDDVFNTPYLDQEHNMRATQAKPSAK